MSTNQALDYLKKNAGKDQGHVKVKNRSAAPVQITAEQILREANDRRAVERSAPEHEITDEEEQKEMQARKRMEFEQVRFRPTSRTPRAWPARRRRVGPPVCARACTHAPRPCRRRLCSPSRRT